MPFGCHFFHIGTSVSDMAAGNQRDSVELITSARPDPLDSWNKRRRLYAWLQFARIPLFVLSGLAWWWTHNHWLTVIIVLISLPLPWVAVLLANDPGEGDRRERQMYKPAVARAQRLEAARGLQLGSSATYAIQPAAAPTVIDDEDITHPEVPNT